MDNFDQLNVENLLKKIEFFYKKFYINKLFVGILFLLGVFLALFLFFDLLFFYAKLPDFIRFTLFYSFIVIILSGVYYWIIFPLLKLFKLASGIKNEEVAWYIGNYYPEIGDKLLNTLQYSGLIESNDLALAVINQKSEIFKAYNFIDAVPRIEHNRRIFLFLIPFTLLISVFFINSRILTEGSERLVNYDVDYSLIAPFSFQVDPGNTTVFSGTDLVISVNLEGKDLPSNVNINIDGVLYRCQHDNGLFFFTANNVNKDFTYHFQAGQFKSDAFLVRVNAIPIIKSAEVTLVYPKYTNLSEEVISNPNRLEVVAGTVLKWNLDIENCESVLVTRNFVDSVLRLSDNNEIRFEHIVFNSEAYSFSNRNDSMEFFSGEIVIVPDEYPVINVDRILDSSNADLGVFTGIIQDDFGFYSLNVRVSDSETTTVIPISITKKSNSYNFYYELNLSEFDSSVSMVFEVRDNDLYNNFKLTKTTPFKIDILSKNQIDSTLIEESELLKSDMEDLVQKSKDLNIELNQIQKDLLNKKELDWSDSQKAEHLIKEQKKLNKSIEETKNRLDNHQEKINKEDVNESMRDKQKQLDDLFEKLMDEDSKKLYKELQELLKKMDKDEIQKHLDKMEDAQKDLEKDLEQNLEIFKQMELEKGLENALDELDSLAKKQEDLSDKNGKKEISNEENIKEQNELNNEFKKLQEELDRLDSLNNDLKEKNELPLEKDKQEEISKKQEESVNDSKEGNQKKSSEKQKEAAEKMKEMKENMESAFASNSSSKEGEDLEALRKLLENLLVLSFEQEELLNELNGIDKSDPNIVSINRKQKELVDDAKMVKDSLYALGMRVTQIQSTIKDEVNIVNSQMDYTIENLAERKISDARLNQQKSLTSINNLAVLLDEIIQQLQEQQKKKNQGSGSCSKPGEGKPKPSLKSSKKRQEELAKQMEALKKQMKKGKSPGKMYPGKMGSGMSKEVATMAAQQELIRKEIRKLSEQLSKEGNMNGAGELKKLEELLENNEEDLINLKLDQEFFNRQQEISVKMLEAENSQREREKDKKRKSEIAIDYNNSSSPELERYLEHKEFELELMRLKNPELSKYYQQLINDYNLKVK